MSLWSNLFGGKTKSISQPEHQAKPASADYDEARKFLEGTDFETIRSLPLNEAQKIALISKLIVQWVSFKSSANFDDLKQQLIWFIQVSVKDVGDAEIVRVLLAKGADKEAWDEKGYTLLHHAAVRGQVAVVEVLVLAGADKEARTKDRNGMTPLLVAAATGQASVVEVLIRSGSNKDATDNKLGMTPLGFAESLRDTSMIEMLRNTSAPANAQPNKAGESQEQSQK